MVGVSSAAIAGLKGAQTDLQADREVRVGRRVEKDEAKKGQAAGNAVDQLGVFVDPPKAIYAG